MNDEAKKYFLIKIASFHVALNTINTGYLCKEHESILRSAMPEQTCPATEVHIVLCTTRIFLGSAKLVTKLREERTPLYELHCTKINAQPVKHIHDLVVSRILLDCMSSNEEIQPLNQEEGEILYHYAGFISENDLSNDKAYKNRLEYIYQIENLKLHERVSRMYCHPSSESIMTMQGNFLALARHTDRLLIFDQLLKQKELSFTDLCILWRELAKSLADFIKIHDSHLLLEMIIVHMTQFPCLMKQLHTALLQNLQMLISHQQGQLVLETNLKHLPEKSKKSLQSRISKMAEEPCM